MSVAVTVKVTPSCYFCGGVVEPADWTFTGSVKAALLGNNDQLCRTCCSCHLRILDFSETEREYDVSAKMPTEPTACLERVTIETKPYRHGWRHVKCWDCGAPH